LYAVWSKDPVASYTITYLKNDGSAERAESDFDSGDTTALDFDNPFERTGYTFLGWATSPGAKIP
jgi:hypothetical protein